MPRSKSSSIRSWWRAIGCWGYENRDVADEDFRNDDVDAGEVGAGLAVTALYELKLEKEKPRRGRLAVIRLRYRSMADGKVREESHVVDARAMKSSWEGATRAFRLSSIVAEFAEILRGSYWAKDGSLEDLFVRAQCLLPDFPGRTGRGRARGPDWESAGRNDGRRPDSVRVPEPISSEKSRPCLVPRRSPGSSASPLR